LSNSTEGRRIAVVGGGIAGMGAAWQLASRHSVTLFERNDYVGGHANTVELAIDGQIVPVDTGFIVFNDRNYPNLTALFERLNVEIADSDMSFGISLRNGGFEYSGSDLAGLFAQPTNIVRPAFWTMLADVKRFYHCAPRYLASEEASLTISELLKSEGYSAAFIEFHLMPMAAAIWSASRADIARYPAYAFIRFFQNHGLLTLTDRPQWKTVVGGSRQYVEKLLADRPLRQNLSTKIASIMRTPDAVVLVDQQGHRASFDDVVIATHADQALQLLGDATAAERETLGQFSYSSNAAWLHEDSALMPRRHRAWSSWNYLQAAPDLLRPLTVTYWMNRLQPLATDKDLFVTLNPEQPPRADLNYARFDYEHPVFSADTDRARQQVAAIQGRLKTWFCGAYLGHGFHEDGLQSGLWVAEKIGAESLLDTPCYDRLPESFHPCFSQAA